MGERAAEERSSETAEREPLDDLAALALAGCAFTARLAAAAGTDARFERKERRFSASYEGFDVHCAVRIPRDDDEGRERLARWGASRC